MITVGTCVLIDYGLELFPTFLTNLIKSTAHLPASYYFCINTIKSNSTLIGHHLSTKINANNHMVAYQYNNIGLRGFNSALQAAYFTNNGALLINDDIILEPHWFQAIQDYPKHTGMITFRPTSQALKPEKFTLTSFAKGHVHFITKEAIQSGFNYNVEYCTPFGPYDVYASLQLALMGFNTYVANQASYTEMTRTNANYEKVKATLYNDWQLMEVKISKLKKQVMDLYPFFWSDPPNFSRV